MTRRLSVLAVVAVAALGGSTARGATGDRAVAKPKLLSAAYGRFRPTGASHSYYALKVRTSVAGGQVVSLEWQRVNPGGQTTPAGIADGGCGLAAKRNGAVGTWYLPMRLKAGSYRLSFKLTASSCDAAGRLRSASRIVAVHVA